MQPIIKIDNLSKMYRLGTIGTGTISHDLNRWWHKVRGKEDPYLKIGEANVSDSKSSSDYVWALKDINLEVMPGEVLGIIGKNGAGKSTLLKILSRVTGPTTGSISYRGRIGSLLEVGTGFHRELTGRENIYLNGAILGMTKAEIRSKLDEIVDFAGVERYIDTPVKRYSSGMTVRLGFAVAAHLEPEILVVDEVLAVGDAEFQKKAIGKMQDVSSQDGRTILFVSHNMASIKHLCTRGLLISNGTVEFLGDVTSTINNYLKSGKKHSHSLNFHNRKGSGAIMIKEFSMRTQNQNNVSHISVGDLISFRITYEMFDKKYFGENLDVHIGIYNFFDEGLIRLATETGKGFIQVDEKNKSFICQVDDKFLLKPGFYYVNIALSIKGQILDYVKNITSFEVLDNNYLGKGKSIDSEHLGKIIVSHSWTNTKNNL